MPPKIYQCTSSVLDNKIDDEVIVMSLEKGFYYGLDDIASRIWELLQQAPATLDELCKTLSSEYEVDLETCKTDTYPFLQQMISEGLIEEVV